MKEVCDGERPGARTLVSIVSVCCMSIYTRALVLALVGAFSACNAEAERVTKGPSQRHSQTWAVLVFTVQGELSKTDSELIAGMLVPIAGRVIDYSHIFRSGKFFRDKACYRGIVGQLPQGSRIESVESTARLDSTVTTLKYAGSFEAGEGSNELPSEWNEGHQLSDLSWTAVKFANQGDANTGLLLPSSSRPFSLLPFGGAIFVRELNSLRQHSSAAGILWADEGLVRRRYDSRLFRGCDP